MTTADEKAIQQNIQSNKTWKAVQDAILKQCDSLLTLQPFHPDMTASGWIHTAIVCTEYFF